MFFGSYCTNIQWLVLLPCFSAVVTLPKTVNLNFTHFEMLHHSRPGNQDARKSYTVAVHVIKIKMMKDYVNGGLPGLPVVLLCKI